MHHCTISCNSVAPLLRQLEEERLVGVNPTRNINPLTISDITYKHGSKTREPISLPSDWPFKIMDILHKTLKN